MATKAQRRKLYLQAAQGVIDHRLEGVFLAVRACGGGTKTMVKDYPELALCTSRDEFIPLFPLQAEHRAQLLLLAATL